MRYLVIIVISLLGLLLVWAFLTGQWEKVTSALLPLEEQALTQP